MSVSVEPFRVPAEFDRHDLEQRLDRTRFPAPSLSQDWGAGVPPAFLRRLVARWRHGYDWPAAVERLNRYPHGMADLDGVRLHFVHARNPGAPAIVLLHGWPYTFAEMLPLADALAGDFEVVVPSLPGFAYSPALDVPFGDVVVAGLVHRLMTEALGHERYLTYGEDVGTWISDRLAGSRPDEVAGILVTHAAFPPGDRRVDLSAEERAFFAWLDTQWEGERGYSTLQATKPDTLAAAVGDSPSGLAAWIAEKFRAWSDCGGDLESRFSLDDLITTAMLFWTTDSIATSFRPYFDDEAAGALQQPQPLIEVPAGVAIQWHEREYPRALAERTYRDIRVFQHLEHGGHFTAAEAPDAVAATLRALVATLGPVAASTP